MINTFKEQQKFRQLWLWGLILGIPLAITIFSLTMDYGEQNLSHTELSIAPILPWLTVLLFYFLELKTLIDKDGIVIQFFPFRKKKINWDEVATAEVLNYGFVGGFGIRMWTKYGTVYNVDGQMGLALGLKNFKKICIGTQRAEELERFVNNILSSSV